jgi:hypothetical protein
VNGIGRSPISAKVITSIFPGGRMETSKCPSTGYPINRYGLQLQGGQWFVIKTLKKRAQDLQWHCDVRCPDGCQAKYDNLGLKQIESSGETVCWWKHLNTGKNNCIYTEWHKKRELLKCVVAAMWPPLWSSGQSFWLQIQRSRCRFPALPDFLSSSGSWTGSTQPREVNWGATWTKK